MRTVTLFIIGAVAAAASAVSRDAMKTCLPVAQPLVTEAQLVVPSTHQQLGKVCHNWRQFVDCVNKYITFSYSSDQKSAFNGAVQTAVKSVHKMCSDPDYSAEYLRHAPCIQKMIMDSQRCGTDYDRVSRAVIDNIADQELCCWYLKFRACMSADPGCPAMPIDAGLGQFVNTFLDNGLQVLVHKCHSSRYSQDKCTEKAGPELWTGRLQTGGEPSADRHAEYRSHRGRPGYSQERAGRGQERAGHSQERPGHGQERPGRGQERAGHGQERPGHGQERPGRGQERAGRDQERPGHNGERGNHGQAQSEYGQKRTESREKWSESGSRGPEYSQDGFPPATSERLRTAYQADPPFVSIRYGATRVAPAGHDKDGDNEQHGVLLRVVERDPGLRTPQQRMPAPNGDLPPQARDGADRPLANHDRAQWGRRSRGQTDRLDGRRGLPEPTMTSGGQAESAGASASRWRHSWPAGDRPELSDRPARPVGLRELNRPRGLTRPHSFNRQHALTNERTNMTNGESQDGGYGDSSGYARAARQGESQRGRYGDSSGYARAVQPGVESAPTPAEPSRVRDPSAARGRAQILQHSSGSRLGASNHQAAAQVERSGLVDSFASPDETPEIRGGQHVTRSRTVGGTGSSTGPLLGTSAVRRRPPPQADGRQTAGQQTGVVATGSAEARARAGRVDTAEVQPTQPSSRPGHLPDSPGDDVRKHHDLPEAPAQPESPEEIYQIHGSLRDADSHDRGHSFRQDALGSSPTDFSGSRSNVSRADADGPTVSADRRGRAGSGERGAGDALADRSSQSHSADRAGGRAGSGERRAGDTLVDRSSQSHSADRAGGPPTTERPHTTPYRGWFQPHSPTAGWISSNSVEELAKAERRRSGAGTPRVSEVYLLAGVMLMQLLTSCW